MTASFEIGERVFYTGDKFRERLAGVTFRVTQVFDSLIELQAEGSGVRWTLEAEDLDLLNPRATQPAPEPRWNATCPRCGAPAYQGLLEVECSKLCSPETTPRADQRQIEEAKSRIEAGLAALSKPRVWTKRVP